MPTDKNIIDFSKDIYRNSFKYFLIRSFNILNNGEDYKNNWHIEAIVKTLEMVESGEIKRLIINMPPRYLKSFCVSVSFPIWLLGRDPSKKIIVASYSEKLAIKHSLDSRIIIASKWFKNNFNDCNINKSQNQKYKFLTTQNGFRMATSVGGTLTGEGGDILIIDDPHNPQDILSNKLREKTLNWYSHTFSSRLNDKKKGAIIIVMQRLHREDLTGFLLKKNQDWFHLNLPIIAEEEQEIVIENFTKHRKIGDILQEEREGIFEIERIKKDMGSYVFNAQYQQNPVSFESSIIKKEWFKTFELKEEIKFEKIYLSFDTAIKNSLENDPTVCSVWGEKDDCFYLINVIRKWLEYPELKKEVINLIAFYRPFVVLIEDKASGQSLIQDLRKNMNNNIIPIKVFKDKITRFAVASVSIESGRVFLPKFADWLTLFEEEIYSFPYSKHDDQVDSVSQFLNWAEGKKIIRKNIRRL